MHGKTSVNIAHESFIDLNTTGFQKVGGLERMRNSISVSTPDQCRSRGSSTAVRALIKQFISAEAPKKPLSDNQISEMLKEQGIDCARRTVAKYREGLRIAPASLRKAL